MTRFLKAINPSKIPEKAGDNSFAQRAESWLRLAKLSFRQYQIIAVQNAFSQLRKSNVILELPQGTGKTLISQLIILEFRFWSRQSKFLVVTPTKELRVQYCRMSTWMSYLTDFTGFQVLDYEDHYIKHVELHLKSSDVVVTTPCLLANRLQSLHGKTKWHPDLCLLDEVDLCSVRDPFDDDEPRFHKHFDNLMSKFTQKPRVIGMTATPLKNAASDPLVKNLNCREVKPYHSTIDPYLPWTQIVPVECEEKRITDDDSQFENEIRECIAKLKQHGYLISTYNDNFMSELKRIASNGDQASQQAKKALSLFQQRVALYEDMEIQAPTAKTHIAAELIQFMRPAILLARFAKSIELFANLTKQKQNSVVHAGHSDYLKRIESFRENREVMLMTRELGKRGLDFPEVVTLVLYGPLWSASSMDQELCRTRSQRSTSPPKIVHVLYYKSTMEEKKLRTVLWELSRFKGIDGKFKYLIPPSWAYRPRQRSKKSRQ